MAKKRKAWGAGLKKTAKPAGKTRARKQTTRQVARILDAGPVRRRSVPPTRPKTPILPGMENMVADRELDTLCSAIADNLHIINEASETLKGLKFNGVQALRKKGRTVYKSHGVEIVRVPGEEKLRTRLVKGEGAANDEHGTIGAGELDNLDNGEGDEVGESLANA